MSEKELERFLDEERVLTCATIGPNGRPHLMPLWYVRDSRTLYAWTYGKSQKARNLERDPRATVQIEAGRDRYGELRGVMLECDVTIERDRGRGAVARGARGRAQAGPEARRAALHADPHRLLGSPEARRLVLSAALAPRRSCRPGSHPRPRWHSLPGSRPSARRRDDAQKLRVSDGSHPVRTPARLVFRLKSHVNDCRARAAQRADGRVRRGSTGPVPAPPATDPASPDGAQPNRGSARMPRGPAIPAARGRRPRRRALAGS